MGINSQLRAFRDIIAQNINNSKLPPEVVFSVLREFSGQVEIQSMKAIEAELKATKEGDKEDDKEIHKD